jgi:hypothetical protein
MQATNQINLGLSLAIDNVKSGGFFQGPLAKEQHYADFEKNT